MESHESSRESTKDEKYSERLVNLNSVWYKRMIEPVNPYRWHIRRSCKTPVLDIGCGIGRNLGYLKDTKSVGVDHNDHSVQIATEKGFTAYTPETFRQKFSTDTGQFQTLLLSHVIEHMTLAEARSLIAEYLPFVRSGGEVMIICPQERGYASDSTHVTFFDGKDIEELVTDLGLTLKKSYSYPLPRKFGKAFIYNEIVVRATKK
jgi:2-polyprenyl-3-methyl-5-hydroxy-6-metoxy-1,4-benzoquinol methylase